MSPAGINPAARSSNQIVFYMSAETSSKRPLTQLNFEIEQVETDVARLETERASVARTARQASRRLRFLGLARWTRRPTASFEFWPVFLMILGPGLAGVLMFILVDLILNSAAIAVLGFLAGLLGGAALFGSLLYRPPNAVLPAAIAEAESHLKLAEARLKEKVERITEAKQRLQRLVDERRDQIASGKLQKAALLQRHWKKMQGAEWDDFVVEVCRTLGAKVDRIARIAADDANFIADFGPRRVAVLTQVDEQNATSATIHKAIDARDRHRCDSCAVILNRRFTGAAQEFAHRNGCAPIGSAEFPDFALGKINL
jgi:hypothetical protein